MARQSAQHHSVADAGSAGAQAPPAGHAANDPSARATSNAYGVDESRNGSAARVQRAVDRLQRQPLQPDLPSLGETNNQSHESELSRLVELEIIPRLMLLHGTSIAERPPRVVAPAMVLSHTQVEMLAKLAAEGDSNAASTYVRTLLDAGASPEQVYLDLLGPAAKVLGSRWEDDAYDFSIVTVALWRLQQIVYEQGSHADAAWRPPSSWRRALLSASPGSRHTFGLTILAEFFTRAGWDVQHEVSTTWDNLRQAAAGQWFDMAGISVAKATDVVDLASAILSLRQASLNPRLLVMVGGPAAGLVTDLAQISGADLTASDAAEAVECANRWMGIESLSA